MLGESGTGGVGVVGKWEMRKFSDEVRSFECSKVLLLRACLEVR